MKYFYTMLDIHVTIITSENTFRVCNINKNINNLAVKYYESCSKAIVKIVLNKETANSGSAPFGLLLGIVNKAEHTLWLLTQN